MPTVQASAWVPSSEVVFQSSEDVGGHADLITLSPCTLRRTSCFNHPKMWGDMPTYPRGPPGVLPLEVSIIRRCGGTCRRKSLKTKTKQRLVSIIRRCGGTCRLPADYCLNVTRCVCFNHPKMWGDMPTREHVDWLHNHHQRRFNHPKMWGDMPTRRLYCRRPRLPRTCFNHPKMWGDMPT